MSSVSLLLLTLKSWLLHNKIFFNIFVLKALGIVVQYFSRKLFDVADWYCKSSSFEIKVMYKCSFKYKTTYVFCDNFKYLNVSLQWIYKPSCYFKKNKNTNLMNLVFELCILKSILLVKKIKSKDYNTNRIYITKFIQSISSDT